MQGPPVNSVLLVVAILILSGVHCFKKTELGNCEIRNGTTGDLKFHGTKTTVPAGKSKCFRVVLPQRSEVVLAFPMFNLLDTDRVLVYAVDSEPKKIFGPYRGYNGFFSIFTGRWDVLLLLETSDDKHSERHFHAKYFTNVSAFENQNSEWGTIASPIYETGRTEPLSCNYSFKFFGSSNSLQKLVLDFVEMDNLAGANLTVVGSESTDGMFSGGVFPRGFFSSGNLRLHLTIDPRGLPNQRFVAHYQLVTSACSGIVEVANGTDFGIPPLFHRSGGAAPAPLSVRCRWLLRGPVGKSIFVSVYPGSSVSGTRDHPTFYDPASDRHSFNGSHFLSTANELWIQFVSTNVRPGIVLRLMATIDPNVAPVSDEPKILRDSGLFTLSPPDEMFVLLEAAPDRLVRLSVPPPPRPDQIILYSDFRVDSKPFLRLLPGVPLEEVVSPTGRMKVESRGVLQMSFSSIDGGCRRMSVGEAGFYDVSHVCGNCSWLLSPEALFPPGSTVEMNFLEVHLDHGSISIHKIDTNLTTMVASKNVNFASISVSLPSRTGIYLRAETKKCPGRLFVAYVVRPECTRKYRLDRINRSVDLRSPRFPDSYPQGSSCLWTVQSFATKLLLLDIRHLRLGHPSHRLQIDGLEVPTVLGYSVLERSVATVTLSAPLESFTQSIGGSFWMTVTAVDCGGSLEGRRGSVRIPSGSFVCVWIFAPPSPSFGVATASVIFSTTSPSRNLFVLRWSGKESREKTHLTSEEVTIPSGFLALLYNRTSRSGEEGPIEVFYTYRECNVSSCHQVAKCDNDSVASTAASTTAKMPLVYGERRSDEAYLSSLHVSVMVVAAAIVGAIFPTIVYCCLLKRSGRTKTACASRWNMIGNGQENSDGISL